jgi:hypothetical protein
MKLFKKLKIAINSLLTLNERLDRIQEMVGRIGCGQLGNKNNKIRDYEFRVFSQFGEDGIIQFLLSKIAIKNKIFIEFGVENYKESNTRFLLVNDNWSGLIIDASQKNIASIKEWSLYWRQSLSAVCAFITSENINQLILNAGFSGEVGILSIDIDGNDYWVWKAINCISPAIVIVEYNARFGGSSSVTIPYDPQFIRDPASYSNLYYGASLSALVGLGKEKGYSFVGCNSAGNNAFFVKKEYLVGVSGLSEVLPGEDFVPNLFREARDSNGSLMFLSREEELKLLNVAVLVGVDH